MGIAMSLLLSTHARGNSAPSNKETTRYIDARATSSDVPVNLEERSHLLHWHLIH